LAAAALVVVVAVVVELCEGPVCWPVTLSVGVVVVLFVVVVCVCAGVAGVPGTAVVVLFVVVVWVWSGVCWVVVEVVCCAGACACAIADADVASASTPIIFFNCSVMVISALEKPEIERRATQPDAASSVSRVGTSIGGGTRISGHNGRLILGASCPNPSYFLRQTSHDHELIGGSPATDDRDLALIH